MVTDSKQAKAAIAVVIMILIFAIAFIIFNFKEVEAVEWTLVAWDMQDGYDFSNKTLANEGQTNAPSDIYFSGWSRKDPLYNAITPLGSTRISYSAKNADVDCFTASYVAVKKAFSNNSYGCIKTNEAYYKIKITDIRFTNVESFSTLEWMPTNERNCADDKNNDDDGYTDCDDSDCNDAINCAGNCIGDATSCSSFVSEDTCKAQDDCTWSISFEGSFCEGTVTACKYFNSQDTCKTQDGCSWNATADGDGDGDDGVEPECTDGNTTACGPNNETGICEFGIQTCTAGKWGACINATLPANEICNALDDDCNAIIDDIDGKDSINKTQCGCFGGADSKNETCNIIDDDCNGKIDENWDDDGDGFVDEDAKACEDVYDKDEYDCDDDDDDINPDEKELCIGNYDEDCDGDPNNGCVSKNQTIFSQTIPKNPVCGDGKCEATESSITCCIDCGKCPEPEPTVVIKKSNVGLYSSLVAIMIIFAGVAGWLLYRKKQQDELESLTEEQGVAKPLELSEQDINSYIKNTLSLGYSPQQIKDALVAKGWDEETVNQELSGVHGDISAMGLKVIEKPSKPAAKKALAKKKPKSISKKTKKPASGKP